MLCLWYYIGKGELGLLSLDHYLYRPWLFVQALAICTIVRAIPAARRDRPYAMLWLRSLSQSRRRYGVCFSLSHNLQHRLRALRALASRVFSHPPHPCFFLGCIHPGRLLSICGEVPKKKFLPGSPSSVRTEAFHIASVAKLLAWQVRISSAVIDADRVLAPVNVSPAPAPRREPARNQY